MFVLSKRLQMLADMVTPGSKLADIGCDHGFLSIYLVEKGICPRAIAMDVRQGPLAGARKHVEEYGLGDYIEIRLSDGLAAYGAGEADTLVCAGMGGRLMEKILTDGMDKACRAAELILQPQSEIREFRAFLRRVGFVVTAEDAVYEEGKYYFAMKAVPGRGKVSCGGEDGNCGGGCCAVMSVKALESVDPEDMKSAGSSQRTDVEATAEFQMESMGAEDSSKIAAPDDTQLLYDLYGELLLEQKHPVLLQYLTRRSGHMKQLEHSLKTADSQKARMRLEEVHREQGYIEKAICRMTNN